MYWKVYAPARIAAPCGPVFYSPPLQSEFIHIYWLIKMSISLAAPRNCNCNEVLAAQQTQRVEKLYFISSNEEKSYIFIRSAKWTRRRSKPRSQEAGKSEVENGKWRNEARLAELLSLRRNSGAVVAARHFVTLALNLTTQLTDSAHTHTYILHRNSYICAGQRIRESYNFWAFHMCPEPGTSLTHSQDIVLPTPTN